jgi:tRNA(fMet)-specific endonuclease VapC
VNKALLDTDIYSEILKAVNPTVARNAATYRGLNGVLTLSVITVMEVIYGLQRVGGTSRIQTFRNNAAAEEILDLDRATADLAGRITGDLDRAGTPIGRFDPIIAAVALNHGLVLVTGNTAHFQRIQQLGYSLTLTNWRI